MWKAVTESGSLFAAAVKESPGKALFAFDFDGTLAQMDPDPEAVSMVEESAAALEVIAGCGVRLAVISGRPVDSLVRLGKLNERPGFSNAVLLGQYGTERLDMATGRRRDPQIPKEIFSARESLQKLVQAHPGAHLEDKGRALAVHTRRMENPEGALADLRSPVYEVANRLGLTVEPGRLVWELRASTTDKGDALRELVSEFRPSSVLMAGDDLGDLAAFAALNDLSRRGIFRCALVSGSSEQPALMRQADVLADGPSGVAQWLTYVARNLVG